MTKLNSSFMIGNVEIPHPNSPSSMAGSDQLCLPYYCKRVWCWSCGDGDEFLKNDLLYNNEKTSTCFNIDENEHPMSIQLFGGDAEGLKRAADFIQTNTKADIVDINMGCPVNKVVKNEAGAKWLKDPDKIYHIVKEVTSVLDIPLTVKMRTGWSDSDLAVENALAAESARMFLLLPCTVVPVNKCILVTVTTRRWLVLLKLLLRFHLSEMEMCVTFKTLNS